MFFFSSRRRHTRFDCDWIQTCALPIFMHSAVHVLAVESIVRLSPHHGSRLEQSIGMRAQHLVQGDPAALESHGATRQIEPVGAQHLGGTFGIRSEEHTSELQSQSNLVCRLLLEKKKKNTRSTPSPQQLTS